MSLRVPLWFAYKLVSLQKISTTKAALAWGRSKLWFAYKLVSLQKISTTNFGNVQANKLLWFAYKLVSLQKISTTLVTYKYLQGSCDLLTN